MNKEKWEKYIEMNTADYGVPCPENIHAQNHLGIAVKFLTDNVILDNKEFLDIGCGVTNTDELPVNWTGVDLIGDKGIKADAHELPFDDKQFDVIFSSHTIEHTLSPLICFLEIYRTLKDDGDFILGVPECPGFMYSGHNYVLTRIGWELLLKNVGFKIIKYYSENNCINFYCRK